MAIQSTNLSNVPLPITPSSASDLAVTVMFFCNLNTPDPLDDTIGRQFLDIYVVKSGDSTSTINQVGNQIPVDAGDTFTFSAERLVLSSGDRIWANATNATQVSVTVSYVII